PLREGRRAAAEEDRLELGGEHTARQLELGEQRVDVRAVQILAPDHGDEVAVAAARGAERQMDIQVPDAAAHRFAVSFRFSAARTPPGGPSPAPPCFIRFWPAFCFSSSLRLRVMSPP